jgi:hypothetical protein
MDKIQRTDFPSHLIDPREKDEKWIKQYIQAAYTSSENDSPREIFYHNRHRYEVLKAYALGQQSINKYKPIMGVDDKEDASWLAIDWSVIPIVPKFRRIALGKLNKIGYNITATPIDSLANEEVDAYFADMKSKILIREAAKKVDPELLESPALQMEEGEAKDMEELEMQMNYTFKHQMSIEAEQGIKLVLEQNKVEQLREQIKEDIFDYGVGGYKEYIDSNGAVKVRAINPRNVIISSCRNKDFSDARHIGEITEMAITDLKQAAGNQFSEEQYENIAKEHMGKLGNPSSMSMSTSLYNKGYDKFKVRVLDMEFYSVNETVYEKRVDRRGNKIFARAKYEDKNRRKEKFERVAYKVVYKGKWIVGTNYIFDAGLCTDMKRAKSSLMDTELSYHLYAPEFFDMKAYGMLEQLVPIADAIQISWYRLQNAINQARPKGIMIEMGALEDIPLGAGGAKLTPMKVLDLYNKTGTLIYRKADSQGRMTNYKPIEELENGLGRDVMSYWQIIQNNIQMVRDVTGMNEFTDGSTPDPRALTTVANLAAEGTNNSLAHIIQGEKKLLESVANAIILRLQDVAKSGNVQGYVRSLGNNTMKFIQVNPNLHLHEFGIYLEDKPTDQQKQMLLGEMQQYKQLGLLEPEDSVMISNIDNIKVAEQLLAFRVKKRKAEKEEEAMRMQQMNAQVQQESAMVAEQAKQQTLQMEGQVKTQLISVEKEYDMKLMQLKYQFEIQLEQMRMEGKVVTKQEENKGKKSVTKLKMGQPDDEEDTSLTDQMFPMEQSMADEEIPEEEMMEEVPEEMAEPSEEEMMQQQMMQQ